MSPRFAVPIAALALAGCQTATSVFVSATLTGLVSPSAGGTFTSGTISTR